MKKLMLFAIIAISSTTFGATVYQVSNPAGQLTINKVNLNIPNAEAEQCIIASLDDLSTLSKLTGLYFAVKESNGKRYGVTSSKVGFPTYEIKQRALDATENESLAIIVYDNNGHKIADIIAVQDEKIINPQEFNAIVNTIK